MERHDAPTSCATTMRWLQAGLDRAAPRRV